MATHGYLISEYVREKITVVTNNFVTQLGGNAPSKSLMSTFKDNWQQAIAEGIHEYISNEYVFDVQTNGAIVIAPPPPGVTVVVANYNVDGNITILPDSVLFNNLKTGFLSAVKSAETNMTSMFNEIFSWLPVVATVTEPGDNVVQQLSTVTGVGTINYQNFNSQELAKQCVAETSAVEYVDSEGNETGDSVKKSWDIIGKYIYQGIEGNVVNIPSVVGSANTTNVPNGTTYTGTALGTIEFN